MATDREVAGIRCGEVLVVLSEYLDDAVTPELRARVDGHLRGCDWCEHFGGAFAETIRELRTRLGTPDPLDAELRRRLHGRLGLLR